MIRSELQFCECEFVDDECWVDSFARDGVCPRMQIEVGQLARNGFSGSISALDRGYQVAVYIYVTAGLRKAGHRAIKCGIQLIGPLVGKCKSVRFACKRKLCGNNSSPSVEISCATSGCGFRSS